MEGEMSSNGTKIPTLKTKAKAFNALNTAVSYTHLTLPTILRV